MKILAMLLLILLPLSAEAKLKIETKVDRLTGTAYLQSSGLRVCPVDGRALEGMCANLILSWTAARPDDVLVVVALPKIANMQEFATNAGGDVLRFKVTSPTKYSTQPAVSSAGFVIPLDVLRVLSTDKGHSLLRITGVSFSSDFDFQQATKMSAAPAEGLRQFLDALPPQQPAARRQDRE